MRANQHSLCKPGRLCTQDHWSISFLGELHFSPVVRWKPYTLTIHLGGFLLRPWPPPPAAASLRGRSLNKPPLEHRSPQAIPESPAVIREPGRGGGWKYDLLCLVSVNVRQENTAILFSRC